MHPSLQQLQKYLRTEIGRQYDNKAVIGGLPKMLSFWEPNARREGVDPAAVDRIVARIRAYPDLSEAERPAAIKALLALVKEAAAGEQKPAPPEKSEAAEAPRPKQTRDQPAAPQPPAAQAHAAAPQPGQPSPATPAPAEAPPARRAPQPASAAAGPPDPRPAKKPKASRKKSKSKSKSAAKQRPPAQRRRSDVSSLSEEPLDPRPQPAPGPRPLKSAVPLEPEAGLDAPLTVLRHIGPENYQKLQQLGLDTLGDALLYFPRRYDNYARMKTINRLEYGEECSLIGMVDSARERRMRGGQQAMLKVAVSDTTGSLELTFFNSQPWLTRALQPGRQIVVSGRVDQYLGRLTLTNPDWEPLDQELLHTGRIVPVYPLSANVKNRLVRAVTAQLVNYWAPNQPDPLPANVVARAELLPYAEALAHIHYPESEAMLEAARHRLAFDELLLLQLGVLRQRQEWQSVRAAPLAAPDEWLEKFLGALPYALTTAQQRVLGDIRADLARAVPMNRLLQGDVGSGKTLVAAAAMALAVQAGAQAALMAPTSILAEQHFASLSDLLQAVLGLPPEAIRLLQGATPAAEKEAIYAGLSAGEVKVVIGTHALIEAPVDFASLGLVVVDEQHRFGVAQRAALRGKGANPHLLVMTATPIPRTLALTVYGDLDLSVIDEMPPGRQPVQTHLLHATERERGYAYVRSQIEQGRQAFLIFPLVEESEKIEAKAAVEEHARLQAKIFPDFKLGLLHGRMKPDEKDEVMTQFRAGEYHILVSTSVVEVGVDVPNATVILIDGANRFGLAQLHQFRGRVGRGQHASTCLLVSDAANARADERLVAMEQTQDGFALAEKDLELRGPGDFLGTRQAGFADLRLAKLSDVKTIEKARREAHRLFEQDPELAAPEHKTLAENLARFWTPGAGDVS